MAESIQCLTCGYSTGLVEKNRNKFTKKNFKVRKDDLICQYILFSGKPRDKNHPLGKCPHYVKSDRAFPIPDSPQIKTADKELLDNIIKDIKERQKI